MQQFARAAGQVGIHEHELGRKAPYEGLLIDESKSPQLCEYAVRGSPRRCSIGARFRAGMPRSRGIAAAGGLPSPPACRTVRYWFELRGVGVVLTVKSTELSPVSWPSGRRTSLFPGGATVGGAGAGVPRTKAFTAFP